MIDAASQCCSTASQPSRRFYAGGATVASANVEDVNTSGVNTGHVVEGQGYRPVVSERNDGLNKRIAILRSNEATEREGPRLEELDPHAKDYPCG